MAEAHQQRTARPEKRYGSIARRLGRSRSLCHRDADREGGAPVPEGRPRCPARPRPLGRLSDPCRAAARAVADQRRNLRGHVGAVPEASEPLSRASSARWFFREKNVETAVVYKEQEAPYFE